jgi:tape measure domain-containing protein
VLGNFGSIITGIESAINLAGRAFSFFKDQAMAGLDAVASYERLNLALTTLNASQLLQAGAADDMASAMEVSSVKAEELLGWMQELAIKSPFTLDGVAQAFRLAMAYGFTADEAQRLTAAFIDFSAGTGASEYNMQLIARAMGQISTAGKLMGQDMLQLTSAGLPVAQILADAFGVTTEQIIDMREDGLLPAAEVIEALTVYMETNFAGAAENFANSWAGLLGTFDDLKQMGLREFFGGLLDAIQPVAIAFAGWLQDEGMEKLRQWGEALGTVTGGVLALAAALTGDGNAIIQFGVTIFELGENNPLLQELGRTIVQMGRDIEEGTPPLEAFQTAISKLFDGNTLDATQLAIKADRFVAGIFDAIGDKIDEWVDGNGPEELSEKMIAWIDTIGTPGGSAIGSKAATAAGNMFAALEEAITRIDWSGIAASIDDEIADELAANDWSAVGAALNENMFQADGSWDDPMSDKWAFMDNAPFMMAFRLVKAIGESNAFAEINTAIDDFFSGLTDPIAQGIQDWFSNALMTDIRDNWISILFPIIPRDEARQWMDDIVSGFIEGVRESTSELDIAINTWVMDHIINPVKRFLGIASPSTVFLQIGKDIVQGLINGILSMFGSLTSVVGNMFDLVTGGGGGTGGATGDATGLLGGGSTGTIGGGTRTHTTTTDTLTGGATINNYFYGAVYVGSMGELYEYDCAPNNPLTTSTGTTGGHLMTHPI